MEPRLEELRPFPGERAIGHGWRLAKAGARLLREQRGLVALTLALSLLISAQLVLSVWVGAFKPVFVNGHIWLARLLIDSAAISVAVYLVVGIAAAVDAAVDGMRLGAREALEDSRECLAPALGWVAIAVASLLAAWAAGRALGAGWLPAVVLGLWFFAGFFVVPMLAVERVGPGAAIGESLALLRERWRKVLGGSLGIALFAAFAFLLGGFVFRHASALEREGHGRQRALEIAGAVILGATAAVAIASREAFATLLMRDGFDDLPGRPSPPPRRGRPMRLARAAGVVVLLLAAVSALGAWTKGDGSTLRASKAPGSNYVISFADPAAVTIDGGAPVTYGGHEVGTVLGSHLEGEELEVSFHVEPGVGPGTISAVAQLGEGATSGPFLELLPSGGGPSEAQSL